MILNEKKTQELIGKISDVEVKQRLMKDIILSLIDIINPNYNSFSLFCLLFDLTAKEVEDLENLLSKIAFEEAFYDKPLSKDIFIKKYEEILPRKKDMLLNLIRALQAEEKQQTICNLFLKEINT